MRILNKTLLVVPLCSLLAGCATSDARVRCPATDAKAAELSRMVDQALENCTELHLKATFDREWWVPQKGRRVYQGIAHSTVQHHAGAVYPVEDTQRDYPEATFAEAEGSPIYTFNLRGDPEVCNFATLRDRWIGPNGTHPFSRISQGRHRGTTMIQGNECDVVELRKDIWEDDRTGFARIDTWYIAKEPPWVCMWTTRQEDLPSGMPDTVITRTYELTDQSAFSPRSQKVAPDNGR